MLLLFVSIVVLVASLAEIPSNDSVLRGATAAPSVVALIWLFCYLSTSYFAFGTPYLFASAYILCLFVFHFGLLVQDGLGLIRIIQWEGPIGAWAVRAGWYANLALACIGTGFSAYALRSKAARMQSPEVTHAVASQNLAWLYQQGIGLLVAAGLLLVLSIYTLGNIFALTRMQLFFEHDTRFIAVFSMFAPAAATALVVAAQTRRQRRFAYLVAAVAFCFFIFLGQRSTAMFPTLVGAVVWVKIGRRINPLLAAAGILSALLIIPVVGYLRTLGTYGEITSAAALSRASQQAEIGAGFREMGGAIGPLIYTLKLIPAEEPYRFGNTYLQYLGFVIPNLGLRPDTSHSRAAAGLNSRPTKEALFDMFPGDWATFQINRSMFDAGGGAGFSGVAEPYFNFGLAGVLVFFLALGLFLAKIDCRALVLHRNWLLFATVIYSFLLPTVRNDFGIFVKPAGFVLIALGIWKLVRRFIPFTPIAGAPTAPRAGLQPDLRSKRG